MDVRVLVANEQASRRGSVIDGVKLRAGNNFHIAGAPVCPSMAWKLRRSTADIVHCICLIPRELAVMLSGYEEARRHMA